MVYDDRLNSFPYGEPEGIVIRPDEYGHACMYFAVVNGNAGARKVNIYKHIIDYHTGYDATTQSATYIGNSTETSAHFKGDYPAMNYSCDTQSINLATSSVGSTDSKTITINNGEYIFGEWLGVITGEDGEAFSVSMDSNNAFSTNATATVTFKINSSNTTKEVYNANLRLFSPVASSNVESNDIVIPLTGVYTGPMSNIENISITENISIKVDNKILMVENVKADEISVYSTTGALIAYNKYSNTIDLSHLNGIYIVNVKSNNATSHTSKVIIK